MTKDGVGAAVGSGVEMLGLCLEYASVKPLAFKLPQIHTSKRWSW